MMTGPILASAGRFSLPTRFVLINDRVPRTDGCCVLCGSKFGKGYVRDSQTRLIYCDVQCFAGHEAIARANLRRKAS
jgi:hypothetical protein